MTDKLMQDIRYALRLWRRRPAFAVDRHPDAGARRRRQHRDVQHRQRRAAAAAAVSARRSGRQRLEQNVGVSARVAHVSRIRRDPEERRRRRDGPVLSTERQSDRRGRTAASHRHVCDRIVFRRAGTEAGARPLLHRRRERSRHGEAGRGDHAPDVAAAFQRRSGGDWRHDDVEWRAAHRDRRHRAYVRSRLGADRRLLPRRRSVHSRRAVPGPARPACRRARDAWRGPAEGRRQRRPGERRPRRDPPAHRGRRRRTGRDGLGDVHRAGGAHARGRAGAGSRSSARRAPRSCCCSPRSASSC